MSTWLRLHQKMGLFDLVLTLSAGKLPTDHDLDLTTVDQNDCQETGLQPATSDVEVDTQDSDELAGPEVDTAYPEPLHVIPVQCDKDESDSDMILRKDVNPAVEPTPDAAADEVRDACADATTVDGDQHPEPPEKDTAPAEEIVSAEQESTLVRSALRSSLDGDDAALLNNFLSKAKAKRAAKAAMASQEDAAMKQKAAQEGEVVIPDLPTPQPRRALEELDANSPSPSPQKVTSPRKAEKPTASPIRKDTSRSDGEQAENGQQQPGSPTTRRSTRTRTPRVPPRTTIPAFQNSLSLRRAKGTEFVFLQRTEAQELSLATRKNTRQNKGNSVLPKYALKSLCTKKGSNEASLSPENSTVHRKGGSGKRVCWNDARLVEFEDGEEPQPVLNSSQESSDEFSDSKMHTNNDAQSGKQASDKRKTSSSRSTRSQATTIATPPSPAARRVRLGNKSTPSAPETGTSLSSSRDTSTPSNKRKKLTPRSPTNALLETPPSKKSVSVSSGAAAITTTNTSSSGATAATSKSSTTSAGGGTKSKSKSIFKANAGSTPMPKRVRSRA